MKVGLIGAGHIAVVHVQAIRAVQGAQIVGVADQFVDYAQLFAKEHDIPAAFATAKEMIEQTRPDVVHVMTPPATHHASVLECLELGCHVLVEKPMTITSAESQELVEAAERHNVMLSVDHNCRFDATVAKARRLIDAGKIGEVVTVEVDFGFNINRYPAIVQQGAEKSHWAFKLNGGPLQDQMPHPASMVVGYLGDIQEVVSLSKNRGMLPQPWADEIRVSIGGEKVHAEIYVSFSHRPDAMVFTARGTQGTIVADMHAMITTIDKDSVLPRAAVRGLAGFRRGLQNTLSATGNAFKVLLGKMDKTNGVGAVVAGFYQAIEKKSEPPVTMQEGKKVVDLINTIWPQPVGPAQDATPTTTYTSDRKPTILVTGASGFVGSHLVEKLIAEGESVRAFTRPSSYGLGHLQTLGCEMAYGDLANADAVRQAMEGIDTVYHIGGAMGGGWETHQAATVQGTQNILDAAKETKPRRIVYYSSLVVYELLGHANGTVVTEDHPLTPHPEHFGPYPMGKIEAEKLVTQAQQDGLATTIIRPGIIIGPRGHVFFPHLGFMLKDLLFIVLGKGNTRLPLVHINNLVEGTIAAANSDAAVGGVYNMVDDGQTTALDYIKCFIDQTKLGSKYIRVPFFMPYCAAGVYEVVSGLGLLKKGATSRRQLRWKHKNMTFSNDRAKRDFNWQMSVSMEDAIRDTFAWYAKTRK